MIQTNVKNFVKNGRKVVSNYVLAELFYFRRGVSHSANSTFYRRRTRTKTCEHNASAYMRWVRCTMHAREEQRARAHSSRPWCCTFFEIQRKVMKYREQQAKLLMRRGPVQLGFALYLASPLYRIYTCLYENPSLYRMREEGREGRSVQLFY